MSEAQASQPVPDPAEINDLPPEQPRENYARVCSVADLKKGDMKGFMLTPTRPIIIVWPENSPPKAYQGFCPHHGVLFEYGFYDGVAIVCPSHGWAFKASNGNGLYPEGCNLVRFPLLIEGDDVLVGQPYFPDRDKPDAAPTP